MSASSHVLDARDALCDIEAERRVIASVLISPDLSALAELDDADYSDEINSRVWAIMKRLNTNNLLEISAEYQRVYKDDVLGYLTGLVSEYPVGYSIGANGYVDRVRDLSLRRQWVRAAQKIVNQAVSGVDADELYSYAVDVIEGIGVRLNKAVIDAAEAALQLMARVSAGERGLSTGFPRFDALIGGIPYGETVIIAGDASVGKTAFCLQMAEAMALTRKKVLYVTTESLADTMVARRVFGILGLPQKLLLSGELTEEQKEKVYDETRKYQERFSGYLFFDDTSISVSEIEASVQRLGGVDCVVIDHLVELHTDADKRTAAILDNFDALKRVAKRRHCGMIVIHTISASDVDDLGARERPSAVSLGWAKDLRYKTDILTILRTPDVEDEQKKELWILKNREGARYVKVDLRFDPLRQWYTDEIVQTSKR